MHFMILYKDLTKAQKSLIDVFIQLRPELTNATSITRKEITELTEETKLKFSNIGCKIGFPVWLTKYTKGRGVYHFPSPDPVVKHVNPADEEFLQELRDAGIDV